MSASQYPITDVSPAPISVRQNMGTLTVYNTSTSNTVYLNEYPNASQGFPLGPGSTITWDQSKDLYAYITDLTKPVTITVVTNGGTITDAKAIADQILAAGLATDIAQEIKLAGAPPIDTNAQIFTDLFNTYPHTCADIDVSQYQSIEIGIYETAPAPGTAPTPRQVSLQFYDAQGINTRGYSSFLFSDTNAAVNGVFRFLATGRMPVLGSILRITVQATANTNQCALFVVGSYKTVPESVFALRSAYFLPQGGGDAVYGNSDALGGLQAWNVPAKAAGVLNNYPSHIAGDGVFSVDADTVTVAGNVRLVDAVVPGVTYAAFPLVVSAAYQRFNTAVILPNRPLRMQLDSALAGTNVTATLAYKVRGA